MELCEFPCRISEMSNIMSLLHFANIPYQIFILMSHGTIGLPCLSSHITEVLMSHVKFKNRYHSIMQYHGL